LSTQVKLGEHEQGTTKQTGSKRGRSNLPKKVDTKSPN